MIKNLISFILPFIVLILVPYWIEKDLSVKYFSALVVGLALMTLGLLIIIPNIINFITIGKGTLAPWSPTKRLVITGMYRYVRNPMIIGVLIVLIGESTAILSLPVFIWAIIFFIINNIFFLLYEEPNLEKKFGATYKNYKKNVPRWLPRLKSYKSELENFG
jgi:protein-S-isoprenylcysteine O-methyltransferase Ste14